MKALLTLLLLGKSVIATAEVGFLANSKILKSHGASISPVLTTPQGEVLPILFRNSKEKRFLISDSGILPLDRSLSKKKHRLNIHSCGSPETTQALTLHAGKAKKELFMLVKPNDDGLVAKWLPAKPITMTIPAACLTYKAGYKNENIHVAKIEGADTILYSVTATTAKKESCEIPDLANDRVGSISDKSCKVLLQAPVDCDGQGYEKGRIGKPLGVLQLSDKNSHESWQVFSASGYEGDAILGIKSEIPDSSTEDAIDFFVYSGC